MNWNKDKELGFITNTQQLDEVLPHLRSANLIAVDTETDGLKNKRLAVGLGLAISEDRAIYIPLYIYNGTELKRPWSDTAWAKLTADLKDLLTTKDLITHNGQFDAKAILNTLGFQILDNIKYDTQLMHHTFIDENPPHSLKDLAGQFLDPDAKLPQDDVKNNVLSKGGSWSAQAKEFYKADYELLGHYCQYDVLYTYGLYNRFKHKLDDPILNKLWHSEVHPLIKVTYELNTTGIRVDLDYFKKLKDEMINKIDALEDEIYAQIEDKVKEYEIQSVLTKTVLTSRSQLGKYLLAKGYNLENLTNAARQDAYTWYTVKNNTKRVLNLDSGDDKAYLLYDVFKLPIKARTASGKPSTAKALLDELIEEYSESSGVIKMLRERSKELKLLNTYVETILDSHEDGRIYPSFNQTGTTSGRYSCGGSSLNLQTLPRSDTRIKAGFIPDEGGVLIGSDYASLEPHAFSVISGEESIKEAFRKGLDFYSTVGIKVLGLKNVSADPNDPNYLGTVDKDTRQDIKATALGYVYGAEAGRIMQLRKCSYEEAKEYYNKYKNAYPNLRKWMDMTDLKAKKYGFVDSLMGRRKHSRTLHKMHTQHKVNDFSKQNIAKVMGRLKEVDGITDPLIMYLECRNSLNSAKNHIIQSLAASILNAASIKFYKLKKPSTSITLSIHDELVISCPKEDAEEESAKLQECMINNHVTDMLDVPMECEPVITDKSLAEAK